MAGPTNNSQFQSTYFSQSQQNFLDGTQIPTGNTDQGNGRVPHTQAAPDALNGINMDGYSMEGIDPSLFFSAQQDLSLTGFDNLAALDPQFLDFVEANGANIDFDNLNQDTLGSETSPTESSPNTNPPETTSDLHDKRKSPGSEKEENENGAKRRDGEEKTAKKPGRKPLTSEPTTKRKAQNRAAQRAFRERKEKHLKDLESKVQELEKQSESTNHENGLLRAQVEKLQVELREYRKRLSLTSAGLGQSPPLGGFRTGFLSGNNGTASQANFQFELPRFGTLPSGPFFGNSPVNSSNSVGADNSSNDNGGTSSVSGAPSGTDSVSRDGPSPKSQSLSGTPANSTANQYAGESLPSLFGNLTSPQNATQTSGDHSGVNQSRLFQFNPSNSTASPSISSNSQYTGGPNSSCNTSPEPSHNSPPTENKDSTLEPINEQGFICHKTPDGEISFCEKLNMACGNTRNPIPRAMSNASNNTPAVSTESTIGAQSTPAPVSIFPQTDFSFDWFSVGGGQPDPVLFGETSFSQPALIGDGDFTGGFFNDAMPTFDLTSPLGWPELPKTGLTPAVQKPNPLEQADALQEGIDMTGPEDEVVPGEDTTQMMSCHKIWDKLQTHERFKDGNIDIDSLCSELRAKACCSESGVVINQKDVEEAFKRLPIKWENSQPTS